MSVRKSGIENHYFKVGKRVQFIGRNPRQMGQHVVEFVFVIISSDEIFRNERITMETNTYQRMVMDECVYISKDCGIKDGVQVWELSSGNFRKDNGLPFKYGKFPENLLKLV